LNNEQQTRNYKRAEQREIIKLNQKFAYIIRQSAGQRHSFQEITFRKQKHLELLMIRKSTSIAQPPKKKYGYKKYYRKNMFKIFAEHRFF
jgi:hypothetical protein